MSEAVVDDIVAMLPPLLHSLQALIFVARHLHPPDFDRVMEAIGAPEDALSAVRSRLTEWPPQFADVRTTLDTASDAALSAFGGLRAVQHGGGDIAAIAGEWGRKWWKRARLNQFACLWQTMRHLRDRG